MKKQQFFYIDKITNSIEDVVTGESMNTSIFPVNTEELKIVLKKNGGFLTGRKNTKNLQDKFLN